MSFHERTEFIAAQSMKRFVMAVLYYFLSNQLGNVGGIAKRELSPAFDMMAFAAAGHSLPGATYTLA